MIKATDTKYNRKKIDDELKNDYAHALKNPEFKKLVNELK